MKVMISWKTFIVVMMVALGLYLTCPAAFAAEKDSLKKYGQEFKGKIAKSYQGSKEW